jgi:hypothetical protein
MKKYLPRKRKGMSSKKCHGLLYSTKNNTECSLPNGLIDLKLKEN